MLLFPLYVAELFGVRIENNAAGTDNITGGPAILSFIFLFTNSAATLLLFFRTDDVSITSVSFFLDLLLVIIFFRIFTGAGLDGAIGFIFRFFLSSITFPLIFTLLN
jgi:hypothetical protein